MNLKKRIAFATYFLVTFFTNSLCANYVHTDFDLQIGYRQDKIQTLVNIYDPPGTLVASDFIDAHDMSSWQIAIKDRWWWCDFYVKAEGAYAWERCGKYKETFNDFVDLIEIETRADTHHGRFRDFSAGAGYMFPLYQCIDRPLNSWDYCGNTLIHPIHGFSIGPVAGWSYHFQKFHLEDPITDGFPDEILDNLRYVNQWEGPWIGVEAFFNLWRFYISAGYEYHWPKWRASWRLDGPDVFGEAFSDKRESCHGQGQVGFLDIKYTFCTYWEVGAAFRIQSWEAKNGHLDPRSGDFIDVGFSDTEVDRVKSAKWKSYSISFDIGAYF